MEPFLFFIAGIAVAVAAERIIAGLAQPAQDDMPDPEEHLERVRLPWQVAPWSNRVRRGVVILLPPLMAIAAWRFDTPQAAAVSFLLVALLVCTATDLLQYRVPDVITYPATALALLATVLMPGAKPLDALVATCLGGGFFLLMSLLSRGGVGFGDVKLSMLIGAGLGLPAAVQALAIGIVAGGLIILALLLAGLVSRRQAVPYAPFLALAAVLVVLLEGASFAPR